MTDKDLQPGERYLEGTQAQATQADAALTGERHLVADQTVSTSTVPVTAAAQADLHTAAAQPQTGLLAGQTDRLVLYEERARVDVVREAQGAVTVRKVVTEREEMIPVTLRRECLEIVVQPGAGCVRLDGKDLEAGQTYQVELSNERATVQKEVVATSEVSFEKRAVTEEVRQTVTLRREVLDVQDPQDLIANRAELEGDLR